jgi:hypothetical protein
MKTHHVGNACDMPNKAGIFDLVGLGLFGGVWAVKGLFGKNRLQ